MNWKKIFVIVTCGALLGMVFGGLFGFGAAKLTPDFFRRVIPWNDLEPAGLATFIGATVGVLLGGGLACFGIIIQTVVHLQKRKE